MQRSLATAASLILCLACSSYAVLLGQDTNFDQRNYHYYDVWAFLHGRSPSYDAPAGVQSFLNPLAEIIPYALIRHLPPRLAGASLGAISGLLLIPIYLILQVLASTCPPRERRFLICVALLVSACSPMAISEIGTTFSDNLLSIPTLFSTFVMLAGSPASYLVAGMLMGLCCGIKLTCMPYAIALAFTTIARPPGARAVLGRMLAVTAGGFLGFIVTGGPWAVTLYGKFGNPVFPWWNGVFRSADFPFVNAYDTHFYARRPLDLLRYPVRWALGSAPSNELPFQDIRFAALLLVAMMLPTWKAVLKARGVQARMPAMSDIELRLLAFFAAAFTIWIFEFGIQRYAVTLELLVGPVLFILVRQVPRAQVRLGVMGLVALATLVTIRTCDWGHTSWKPRWYDVAVPGPVQRPGIIVLGGAPLSYIVPFLPGRDAVFGSNLPILLTAVPAAHMAVRFRAAARSDTPMWLVTGQQATGRPLLAALAANGLSPSPVCYRAATGFERLSYCLIIRHR